jgi:hypothetical protein
MNDDARDANGFPRGLGAKQVNGPGQRDDECQQRKDAPYDDPEGQDEVLPMHAFLPEPLKRFAVAGSCCGSVFALSLIVSGDHGWIPGIDSPFAAAGDVKALQSDVADMYLLSLALTIRELSDQNCRFYSPALTAQIEGLQRKYVERTKVRYLHECKSDDAG